MNGGGLNTDHVGLNETCIINRFINLERNIRQEVAFADHHQLTCAKHFRILARLVVAFRCAENHNSQMLPQIMGRRANKVADVLDEQEFVRLLRKSTEPLLHKRKLQMARPPGRQLFDRKPGSQSFSVAVRSQIAHQNASLKTPGPMLRSRLQQRRLASPR